MKINNFLNNIVLKQVKNGEKLIYFVNMSKLDEYCYEPDEDFNGFYFTININNENIKVYQSGEYPNAFVDEYVTQSFIFSPINNNNVELHIINDYE